MKENSVRKYIIVVLLMLVILVIGTTYALFTKSVDTKGTVTLKSGTRYIGIYGPDKENIGLNVTYTFTIENRGIEEASYQVTLEDIINTVGRENINYTYTNGETTKTGKLSDGIIEEENLGVGEKVTVTIRLTSDLSGDYKGKIKVTTNEPISKIYQDESGANPPELVGDMIPVVYNEENKYWEKADISKEWYNYEKQNWANAVTIKDQTKRAEYVSASAGTEIPIENINTMMVWIPRYSYTLGNTYGYKIEGASEPSQATPGAFDIKFVDKNTTEMGAGKYTGDTPSEYFTPSSFCWGDTCDDEATRKDAGNIELSGIWVAKFETSADSEEIISVPNYKFQDVSSLTGMHSNIDQYMNESNGKAKFGLSGNYDAHMIKNTEWGAFTYLSQSKYGKYGNKNYSGLNKKIYSHLHDLYYGQFYLTGCSSGVPEGDKDSFCAYKYDSGIEGYGASTTGTIYGIYDASSGGSEFVMGQYPDYVDTDYIINLKRRYYNLYNTTNFYTGIKGDATIADGTTGFYNAGGGPTTIFTRNKAWIARVGYCSNCSKVGWYADLFSYSSYSGNGLAHARTRFALVMW